MSEVTIEDVKRARQYVENLQTLENKVASAKEAQNPMIIHYHNKKAEKSEVCLVTTLDNAITVVEYLMINDKNDAEIPIARHARQIITECALNALEFVRDNFEPEEIEL